MMDIQGAGHLTGGSISVPSKSVMGAMAAPPDGFGTKTSKAGTTIARGRNQPTIITHVSPRSAYPYDNMLDMNQISFLRLRIGKVTKAQSHLDMYLPIVYNIPMVNYVLAQIHGDLRKIATGTSLTPRDPTPHEISKIFTYDGVIRNQDGAGTPVMFKDVTVGVVITGDCTMLNIFGEDLTSGTSLFGILKMVGKSDLPDLYTVNPGGSAEPRVKDINKVFQIVPWAPSMEYRRERSRRHLSSEYPPLEELEYRDNENRLCRGKLIHFAKVKFNGADSSSSKLASATDIRAQLQNNLVEVIVSRLL